MKRLHIIAIGITCLSPFAARALAGETIVYPSTMCTYFGVTDGAQTVDSGEAFFSYGYIETISNSVNIGIICPIPRPSTADTQYPFVNILDDVKIYYRDRNDNFSFACTVRVEDKDWANQYGASFSSGNVYVSATTDSWSSGAIGGGAFTADHQAYLFCEIPRSDWVDPNWLSSKFVEYIVDYP